MRFYCRVHLDTTQTKRFILGEAWGKSRQRAEQQAARQALAETTSRDGVRLVSEADV